MLGKNHRLARQSPPGSGGRNQSQKVVWRLLLAHQKLGQVDISGCSGMFSWWRPCFDPLTFRVLPIPEPWAQHRFPSCEALPIPPPQTAAAFPRTRAVHPAMDGFVPLSGRIQHVWSVLIVGLATCGNLITEPDWTYTRPWTYCKWIGAWSSTSTSELTFTKSQEWCLLRSIDNFLHGSSHTGFTTWAGHHATATAFSELLQLAILLAQLSSWCPQGSEQVTDRAQGSCGFWSNEP